MLFYDIIDLVHKSFLNIFFFNFSNDEAKVVFALEDVFVEKFAGFPKLLDQKIAIDTLEGNHVTDMYLA